MTSGTRCSCCTVTRSRVTNKSVVIRKEHGDGGPKVGGKRGSAKNLRSVSSTSCLSMPPCMDTTSWNTPPPPPSSSSSSSFPLSKVRPQEDFVNVGRPEGFVDESDRGRTALHLCREPPEEVVRRNEARAALAVSRVLVARRVEGRRQRR